MAICTFCGEKVEHLRNYQPIEVLFLFTITTGEAHWEEYDKIPMDGDGDFECPECGNVLFSRMADAIEFLSDAGVEHTLRAS